MIQTRVTRLGAIPEMTQFLVEVAPYDLELYTHAKSKSTLESSLQVLKAAVPIFARMSDWSEESIRQVLVDHAGQANLKTGTVMWPVRVALSGLQNTPGGALEIAAALGKAETIRRIEAAVTKMQGL
jgi:glutamyl-tRNA synthetase